MLRHGRRIADLGRPCNRDGNAVRPHVMGITQEISGVWNRQILPSYASWAASDNAFFEPMVVRRGPPGTG